MPSPDRWNVLFINTDQQRWDTLGCYGSPVARTPNLDRLAVEGVRFDRCYATNPVCMPARASWFTGQYPSHNGCWMNGVPLPPSADLLQHRLRDAGVHTALIGKIHLDNVWQRNEPHPAYGFERLDECEGDPYCFDAGIDGPALMQGRPLFDAEGTLRPAGAPAAALTEWRESEPQKPGPYTVARCLRTDQWKLVHYHSEDFGELYDLEHDPAEFENLWARPEHRETRRALEARLLAFQIETEPCPLRTDLF